MSDYAMREWRFYLADMIAFAGKAIEYTEGLEQGRFVASIELHRKSIDTGRVGRRNFPSSLSQNRT